MAVTLTYLYKSYCTLWINLSEPLLLADTYRTYKMHITLEVHVNIELPLFMCILYLKTKKEQLLESFPKVALSNYKTDVSFIISSGAVFF